jgi:hypothetical protein
MAQWKRVHFDGLEEEFVDQDGINELTVPAGHRVLWDNSLPRPEMDSKRASAGHTEIYEGEQAAVGFLPYARFKWWCYTVAPIAVDRSTPTRAAAQVMVISHGIQGDPMKAGDCGMRVGLSPHGIEDPFSAAIKWSEWYGVRETLANERHWAKLQTPELIPQVEAVRLWVQCNADLAADISAGHWDQEIVEQYDEEITPPPPPPGTEVHTVRVMVEVDGQRWIDETEQFSAQATGVTLSRVGQTLLQRVAATVMAPFRRNGG